MSITLFSSTRGLDKRVNHIFAGQLVSGLIWLVAAVLGTWLSRNALPVGHLSRRGSDHVFVIKHTFFQPPLAYHPLGNF